MRPLALAMSIALLAVAGWSYALYQIVTVGVISLTGLVVAFTCTTMLIVLPWVLGLDREGSSYQLCGECRCPLVAARTLGFCIQCGKAYSGERRAHA